MSNWTESSFFPSNAVDFFTNLISNPPYRSSPQRDPGLSSLSFFTFAMKSGTFGVGMLNDVSWKKRPFRRGSHAHPVSRPSSLLLRHDPDDCISLWFPTTGYPVKSTRSFSPFFSPPPVAIPVLTWIFPRIQSPTAFSVASSSSSAGRKS